MNKKKILYYALAVGGAIALGFSFTQEPAFVKTILKILAFIIPGIAVILKGGTNE